MLGPAYAIPTLRKKTNCELDRYVKAEFRDNECYWFNCASNDGKAGRRSDGRRSPLNDLFVRTRKDLQEAREAHSSCALTLNRLAEEDPARASGHK